MFKVFLKGKIPYIIYRHILNLLRLVSHYLTTLEKSPKTFLKTKNVISFTYQSFINEQNSVTFNEKKIFVHTHIHTIRILLHIFGNHKDLLNHI